MPPQKGVYEVWNPKSKSTYEFWWDKDTEPDYDSVLKDIDGMGGQTKKSALSRFGSNFGQSLKDQGQFLGNMLLKGPTGMATEMMNGIAVNHAMKESEPVDPNAKPKSMLDKAFDATEYLGMPVKQLREGDYAGALGYIAPDLLLGGIGKLTHMAKAGKFKPRVKPSIGEAIGGELVDDIPTEAKRLGDGGRITDESRMLPDIGETSPTNTGTTFYAGQKGTVPANTRYYYDPTNHAIIKGDHTLLPEDLPELIPLSNEVAISTLGQVPNYRMRLSDDLVAGEAIPPGSGKPMSLKEYMEWKGTSRQTDITKELAKGGKPIQHKQPYVEREGYFKLPRQIKVDLEVPGPIGASKKKPMQGGLLADLTDETGYPGNRNAMEPDDIGRGPDLGLPRGDGLDKPSAPFKGRLTPERIEELKREYKPGDTIDVELLPGESVVNGRIVKDPNLTEHTRPGPGRTVFQTAEAEKVAAKTDPKDGLIDPKSNFVTDVQGDTTLGLHRGYRKFMESVPEIKAITDRWIQLTNAAKVEGLKVRYDFKDRVGKFTKEQLPEFQRLMDEGQFDDVKTYFANKLQWLRAHGVTLDEKANYLPQLWDNPVDEVTAAFRLDRTRNLPEGTPGNKTLSNHAPFEFRSLIKDYKEGIEKGLTPKYSPLELMEWYEERANKLVADRDFLNELKKRKIIVPSNQRPKIVDPKKQWLDIDTNALRPLQQGGRSIAWATDPRYKAVIENQLRNPTDNIARIANFTSGAKSISLSSGIPMTSINSLGMMMAKRAAQEGGISRLGDALKFMVKPSWAEDLIVTKSDVMVDGARHGLTLGMTDDIKLGRVFDDPKGKVGKLINKGVDLQHKWFEEPMFKKMIPALKIISWEDNVKKLMTSGMSEEVAKRKAADFVNDQYASINYDLLYRDKQFQNKMRVAVISPSLLESNFRIGRRMAQSIVKPGTPENAIYKKMAARTLATYAAANVINIINTGEPMWNNPPGREFDIAWGRDGEKLRFYRLFGSESDMLKIPVNAVIEAFRGNGSLAGITQPIINKASPVTSLGIAAVKGENWRGEPNLFSRGGKDRFGREASATDRTLSTLDSLSSSFLPQVAQAGIGLAKGESFEESIGGLAEAPFVYSKDKRKPSPFGKALGQVGTRGLRLNGGGR